VQDLSECSIEQISAGSATWHLLFFLLLCSDPSAARENTRPRLDHSAYSQAQTTINSDLVPQFRGFGLSLREADFLPIDKCHGNMTLSHQRPPQSPSIKQAQWKQDQEMDPRDIPKLQIITHPKRSVTGVRKLFS
jgi:hypothetical protein